MLLLIAVQSYSQSPSQKEIAIQETIYIPAAGCDNGRARSNLEIPLKGGAQPACLSRGKPSFLPDRETARREGPATEVGTVIVLSVSSEQVILAADSRVGQYQRNGRFKGTSDRYCKLVELTPSILFAAAGMTKAGGGLPANIAFDAQQLARQAARNFVFDPSWMKPGQTITEIAASWAGDVNFRIRRGASRRDYLPPESGTWIIGVFAGAEPSGEISVAVARLDYHRKRAGWSIPEVSVTISIPNPPKDFTWIEAFGHKEVVEKYVSERRKTDSTQSQHLRIRREQLRDPSEFSPDLVQELLELTYVEDPNSYPNGQKKVGGSIDIARLQKGRRIQWIHRKRTCVL